MCARSRPILPLTPLPSPAVRRASSPGLCRVPLESSTLHSPPLPSHSILLPPFLPPPLRSPQLPPSPGFLPSLLSSDLNLVPSRFLPSPARACGAVAGGKAAGSLGVLPVPPRAGPPPRPRWGAAGPHWVGERRLGLAIAIARPWGAAWGKGSGAATSPLPALPARPLGAGVGAAEVSPAPGAFPLSRGGPCAQIRIFPWVEGRRGNVPQFYFTFSLVLPDSAELLVFDTGRLWNESWFSWLQQSAGERRAGALRRKEGGLSAGFAPSLRCCPHVCITDPSQQELLSPFMHFERSINKCSYMHPCVCLWVWEWGRDPS